MKTHCTACAGMEKPLSKSAALKSLKKIPDWKISKDEKMISRHLVMKNFLAAIKLVNKIGIIAEKENHHPDLHLTGYRNLQIDLSTHEVKGLTTNDFIMATKIDQLPMKLKIKKNAKN